MSEATRTCFRCARAFAGKAGRIVKGRPACPSCGNALRPAVGCDDCGRPTFRPRRSPDHGGLICSACHEKPTHATCRRCGKYRHVATRHDDGRATCAACSAPEPAHHDCPDCGTMVPGPGRARCMTCALGERIRRVAAAHAEKLTQPWARDLFLQFHAELDPRHLPGDFARRIPQHLAIFRELDRDRSDPASLTQTCLLDMFGAEGLRRVERLTAFLVARLAIPWDEAVMRARTATDMVGRTLAVTDATRWGRDIRRFNDTLIERGVSARTVRVYVAAAAGLMRHADVDGIRHLTSRHVNGWLHWRRGHAASLGRFLSWVATEGGPRLKAHGRPGHTPRKRERILLRKARTMARLLDDATTDAAHRSTLLRIAAIALGVPLENLAALRGGDIQITPEGVGLDIINIGPCLLPAWLGNHFLRAKAGRHGPVFPGRARFRLRCVDGTRHHLPDERSCPERWKTKRPTVRGQPPSWGPLPHIRPQSDEWILAGQLRSFHPTQEDGGART